MIVYNITLVIKNDNHNLIITVGKNIVVQYYKIK